MSTAGMTSMQIDFAAATGGERRRAWPYMEACQRNGYCVTLNYRMFLLCAEHIEQLGRACAGHHETSASAQAGGGAAHAAALCEHRPT